MTNVRVFSVAERPDLARAFADMPTSWPEFMKNDPMGWGMAALGGMLPEFHFVAVEDGEPVALARSAPFPWTGRDDDLPDQGWDDVIGRALRAHQAKREVNAVTALEISVRPDRQRRGLSGTMLDALRSNARSRGFADLVAPVRPSAKQLEPRTPMSDYAARRRADGLPHDPWLRVHVRAGAEIVKVCPASMCIAAPPAVWRAWTGLPFDIDGDVDVPLALSPVHVSLADDICVYVEPNVWVRHRL